MELATGFASPATFEQNRLNRTAFFQNMVMSGNAERIRQTAIRAAKKEQEEFRKKADKGGIMGGIGGGIIGAITGFFQGGGPVGALVGGATGAIKGYETGRQAGDGSQGALIGAAQGTLAGYEVKKEQDATKLKEDTLKANIDIAKATKDLKMKELENKKDLARIELEKETSKNLLKKTERVEAEVVKLQGQGLKLAEDYDQKIIDDLPQSAFVKIGTGENQVTMVKKPAKLTPENATKLSVLEQGRNDYVSIINDINSKKHTAKDVRAASTKLIRLSPELQPIKNKLEFMVEALARGLSGAAIMEDEMDRFRSIFAVKSLDSDEEVINKIERAIRVADRIETSVLWGATPSEKAQIVKDVIKNNPESEQSGIGFKKLPDENNNTNKKSWLEKYNFFNNTNTEESIEDEIMKYSGGL